jgi:purine-binding chemotaxis protein CheW
MSIVELSRQLVVFTLGEEEYALPITSVQEIIRYSEPRPVASDAMWIRGVISLRGKIVPVCDLASRLGLATMDTRDQKIVIVETANGTAGVIVDNVQEVMTIDEQQLDEVPGAGSEFIQAIAKIDTRLVVLLNPESIFIGLEAAA